MRLDPFITYHDIVSNTLKEYYNVIEDYERKEEGVILKMSTSEVQIYLTSTKSIMVSINGIAKMVESFSEAKSYIESEANFYSFTQNYG